MDVVLLDLNLPDSSGLETAKAMLSQFPQIPVIILSGTTDEMIAMQSVRLGAQDYIFKGKEAQAPLIRMLFYSMERKSFEQRLCQAQETVLQHERMAAVGTLATGVAHEFNNIGAVILGNTEMALRLPDLPTQVRKRLIVIHDAIRRSGEITTRLLCFVRGFQASESTQVLQEVLRGILHMAQSTIKNHRVTMTLELAEEPVHVLGNASEIGQVFLNLIVNACHAMDGSPRRLLTIVITGEADGFAVIRVRDTGMGIPPKNLSKLFNPFFSTKGEHARDEGAQPHISGTGLGLAVCAAYIHQHGGTIGVLSKVDLGTTFEIRLPICAAEPVENDEKI